MDRAICVDKLKVLADVTRLSVLRHLAVSPQTVSALEVALGIEQSLLSHHLRTLRRAHLVVTERQGKSVLYRLSPKVKSDRDSLDLDCCVLSFR